MLNVAGCAVCASAAPNSWRIGGCAGCCWGRLTVFAAHTPPSSGHLQPASLCFRVREPQAPCTARAPAVAHCARDPPGADEQRRCAAGAPGLAPWVPDPLRAAVAARDASGASVVAHRVQVPASVGGQRRCAAGAPGWALWVPHPLRAHTTRVVPFPLTAGLPLVGTPSCQANSPPTPPSPHPPPHHAAPGAWAQT